MSQEQTFPEARIDTDWSPQAFDPKQAAAHAAAVEAGIASVTEAATEDESPHAGPGGLVRIELYLAPEQLSHFFRAVVATQHAILTLREAAAYLRISAKRLRTLAEEGQIPAFLIEGHWRFAKQSVDEWTQLHRTREEENDAA